MVLINNIIKKYPSWIAKSPIFSKLEGIRKIFPEIGLPDFEEKITLSNKTEIKSAGEQLLLDIAMVMGQRKNALLSFISSSSKVGTTRGKNADIIISLLTSLSKIIQNKTEQCIKIDAHGKGGLIIPCDIYVDKKIYFKAGAGLFKAYGKIAQLLEQNLFAPLRSLESYQEFKTFSSINLPSTDKTILKFTSSTEEGIWDIATMSMRGISSCQTWKNGRNNSIRIIGSMVDPYTGIIYLTNGTKFNEFGSKMVRRCIVRYVCRMGATDKPALIIERMYPAFDSHILEIFKKALSTKFKGEVYYIDRTIPTYNHHIKNKYFVPLSEEVNLLASKEHPYVDSEITYENINDIFALDKTNIERGFISNTSDIIKKTIKSKSFSDVQIKKYSKKSRAFIKILRSKSKTNSAKLNAFADNLAVKLLAEFKQSPFTLAHPINSYHCCSFIINDLASIKTLDTPIVEYFTNHLIHNLYKKYAY